MTTSRTRGLIVAALFAIFAALPAAAEAAAVSTTTSCLDVSATTDQYVDYTASALDPAAGYYAYLALTGGEEDGAEVGSPTQDLVLDADGNGSSQLWFDQGTFALSTT